MRYPTPAHWRIRVLSVHDGDTPVALVDRGHEETATWAIRLKDVFAPELKQLGGPETRAYVQAWILAHGDGSDWPLLLETFRTPRSDVDTETLGRFVGVIEAADGAILNEDVQAFVTERGYPGGVGS